MKRSINEITHHSHQPETGARDFQVIANLDAAGVVGFKVSCGDVADANTKANELLEGCTVTLRASSEDGTRIGTHLLRENVTFEVLEVEPSPQVTAHGASSPSTTALCPFHGYFEHWLLLSVTDTWLDRDIASVLLLELLWLTRHWGEGDEGAILFEPAQFVCGQRFGAKRTMAALALLEENRLVTLDRIKPAKGEPEVLIVQPAWQQEQEVTAE